MDNLLQDIRFALRTMRKSPLVTLLAVVSLAIGIGANTAIFSLVHAVFLRGVPAAEPERVMVVWGTDETQGEDNRVILAMSRLNYLDLREANRTFEELAGYLFTGAALSAGEGEPEQVGGVLVSGNYFDALGLEPAAGRFFRASEDEVPGRDPVVVLSHAFWQERFGGDTRVVGDTVRLSGETFTVVGVAPEGFGGLFLFADSDFFAPLAMHDSFLTGTIRQWYDNRRAAITLVFGRLAPGVSREQAEADLENVFAGLEAEHPVDNEGRSVDVVPLTQASLPPAVRDNFVRASAVLMTLVGVVLLVACANVANLLLARALGRRKEIAVRLAMGAERGRLVRQLLSESLVLAVVAGVLSLGVAWMAIEILWSLRPDALQQGLVEPGFDPLVLGFTFVVALATGFLFGLAPALQATRPDVVADLKEARETHDRGLGLLSFRNVLVMLQVAFSLLALIGAGLFLRSLDRALAIDPGFDADNLAAVSFNLSGGRWDEARGRLFLDRLEERAATVAGVEETALASNVPLGGGGFLRTVIVEGRDPEAENNSILTPVDSVSESYFRTLGIPLLRGRGFTSADRDDAPRVAVLNETAAERFWPEEEALGRRFEFFGMERPVTVVGIAADGKYGTIGEEPQPRIFLSRRQFYVPGMNLFVRTAGDPGAVLPTVERELRRLDPELPILASQTMDEVVGESLWAARTGAGLLGLMGLLALLLALAGIYGVMSFAVGTKRREIGIRMALGAKRRDVVGLFVGRGMIVVGVGLAIGIAVALLAGETLESLLYGLSATDLVTFTATTLLLAVVAFLATLLPARRAATTDPVKVLKAAGR